jgi:DNA-binding CsgD family transcriptional regulator
LAANAARDGRRLLTIVDDAHWIDRESLEALAFWGRRIRADGIALLFGAREQDGDISALASFESVTVGGLPRSDAKILLEREFALGVSTGDADRLVAETGGNPLALIELAHSVRDDRLATLIHSPQPLPVGQRLEDHFGRRVLALPVETQMLLLLAAADSSHDIPLVWRAAALLGIPMQAADRAETDELLTIDSDIRFRHPLIRSAVYRNARPADRRAVHRALADANGDEADDRQAWHLAASTLIPDEPTAELLAERARDMAAKGSHNSAASLLRRAAELTPENARAADRYLAAANAAAEGLSPQEALAFLERVELDRASEAQRAEALRIKARACFILGQCSDSAELYFESLGLSLGAEPTQRRRDLLEALEAAHIGGTLGSHGNQLRDALGIVTASSSDSMNAQDIILEAVTALIAKGFSSAVPQIRAAVDAIVLDKVPAGDVVRWSTIAGRLAWSIWDQQAHEASLSRVAQAARRQGDLPWLASILQGLASNALLRGDFTAAESFNVQACDIYEAILAWPGQRDNVWIQMRAWQGDSSETLRVTQVIFEFADALGLGAAKTVADIALSHYHLGFSEYAAAKEHALPVFDEDPPLFGNEILDDLIEAAVRTGDSELAERGLARLRERAEAANNAWGLGVLARSRALVDPAIADDGYQVAITLLGDSHLDLELARTHLLYGEWLRQENRGLEARDHLRVAYNLFDDMGAAAFAQRASRELRATGERTRARTVETTTDLTPQESHIAELAAAGCSNAEIAAQLFISASTVDYHLRSIFRKLGITSRRDLPKVLAS